MAIFFHKYKSTNRIAMNYKTKNEYEFSTCTVLRHYPDLYLFHFMTVADDSLNQLLKLKK